MVSGPETHKTYKFLVPEKLLKPMYGFLGTETEIRQFLAPTTEPIC